MIAAPWRRAEVDSVQLDPGVRGVVSGARRQPDHELDLVALLSQEPVEDEGAEETARPVGP